MPAIRPRPGLLPDSDDEGNSSINVLCGMQVKSTGCKDLTAINQWHGKVGYTLFLGPVIVFDLL